MRAVELDGLVALLDKPRGAKAALVLAHGAGAGMRHAFLQEVAGALADRAIATLRYEFPYMTAGRARTDKPEVAEAAVRRAWEASRKYLGKLPRFAGGKSFGGRMTSRAHAAEPLADCRGLVFLGFPLHPADKPEVAGDRAEHLPRAAGPLLFLQGTRDELAPLDRLRPIVSALGPRATLHVVDGADHGYDVLVRSGRTHYDVITELAGAIADWILDR
ncbi:MAG TPA: alpha/beta family hydrolase [Kofleriaceae bacterium]